MVADSVAFLRGRRASEVLYFDAEHFFDGYDHNPEFSLRVLEGAAQRGASRLVLCDTNGGSLPDRVEQTVGAVVDYFGGDVGVAVHTHDDAGTGVANALAGVRAGRHPRSRARSTATASEPGNCNLTTVIPNLALKLGIETIPPTGWSGLTPVAHHVAELVNMALNPQAPYVGRLGLRAQSRTTHERDRQAPRRLRAVSPELVGNGTRFVVSELAGRSTILLKAKGARPDPRRPQVNDVVDELKRLEHEGYHFEVADGSLELLMRRATGWRQSWFSVESFPASSPTTCEPTTPPPGVSTEATIKVHVGGERIVRTAEGNGPVNALDAALRSALGTRFPALDRVHLTDYKVRVLDTEKGTGCRHPGPHRHHQR